MTLPTTWPRFSEYHIRDGAVAPCPGASLSLYNPWQEFAGARSGRKDAPAPPQGLLQLAQRRRHTGEVPFDEIVQWCSQHGLLGLLPHQVQTITFPDRERIGDASADRTRTVQYLSTSRGWQVLNLEHRIGPGVVMRTFTGRVRHEADLGAISRRFFPDLRTHLQVPLSDRFWKFYAEPVEDFLEAASRLLDAVEEVAAHRVSTETGVEPATALNALRTSVTEQLVFRDGQFERVRGVPSLLAAFAAMITEDFLAGRRPLRCGHCETIFLSSMYKARFCSPRCRNVHLMREHRLRHRGKTKFEQAKRSMRRKGMELVGDVSKEENK